MAADVPAKRAPSGAAVFREEITEKVLQVAVDELAARGVGRFSMDAVARRCGVGKSAMYRRWPAKQELIVAAMSRISMPLADFRDTGSLRGDVRAMFAAVATWMSDPLIARILPDLIAEAHRSTELARQLSKELERPRRDRGSSLIDRAVNRGELDDSVDRELALDLMAAPVFWRVITRRSPADDAFLDGLTEAFLSAVLPR